jgi:hypothetical protein
VTRFQKRAMVLLICGACFAAVMTAWSLRRPFINAAQAELQARKIFWFQILGTRIPCGGPLDIGVTVVFKNSEQGELIGGRLCRPPDWSSEWIWYPDPGDVRSRQAPAR